MYRRPYKNGIPDTRYPENWLRLRYFIFKRDHYTCQYCGRDKLRHPHCHHIRPVGCGGSHSPNNLITLCERCHKLHHNK